jgi:hypothetical protein
MTIVYMMIACQLLAWGWFSINGQELPDKKFLIYIVGMLLGQAGAGIETFLLGAWGAFTVQIYFFAFTAFAGIKRFRQMKRKEI